ncbi:MAG: hypothetical protein MUF38_01540 [Anaerolineae bacterium]|jgi:hypothetical protein|nr:hypothetical protein [Anaerolineae bacterium]
MLTQIPPDFNPDEYTAFDSFIPKYRGVNDFIWETVSDGAVARYAIAVLDTILYHCDGWGMCFPLKIKTIRIKSHLRWANAVEGLCVLSADHLGWLREVRTALPRQKVQVDWIISPTVIHVKPERISVALEQWKNSFPIKGEVFRGEHKPESKPESKPARSKPDTSTRYPTREGHNEFRVPYVHIDLCREELTNSQDEMFAKDLAGKYGTHLTVARQYLLTFGRISVENAANEVEKMKNGGASRLKNAGGALRLQLEMRYRVQQRKAAAAAAQSDAGAAD